MAERTEIYEVATDEGLQFCFARNDDSSIIDSIYIIEIYGDKQCYENRYDIKYTSAFKQAYVSYFGSLVYR